MESGNRMIEGHGPLMKEQASPPRGAPSVRRLLEVAGVFLKLGFTAFGGPAAHVALMHEEVVKRRKWVDDQQFLDLLGATNLIPGPNSTEMVIHLSLLRAGWPGFVLGGLCFVLPAMLIVLALAWVYVRLGHSPAAEWLLYGIKPTVIAIITKALWDLGRKAVKGPLTLAIGALVFGLYFVGVNEIGLLFAGGMVVMVAANLSRLRQIRLGGFWLPWSVMELPPLLLSPFSLPVLFLTFLKIGAVLYGGGYVLLAFLRADFVVRLGWLTDQQLIDAIAIGQVTPGPLFTTATFIGFLLGGVPGALLATLGIFLPSFFFVAVSNPLIPRLRRSPWMGGLLDGVNVSALGLMGAVSVQLGRASLIDPVTVALFLASLLLLLRFKLNATWLVLGGAAVGVLSALIR
jgi:chromate transporter